MILRDGRFRASAAMVMLLLGAASVAGWLDKARVGRECPAAQDLMREQWESQGRKNPHSVAHYIVYAFRPRTVPSFVDPATGPALSTGR